MNNLLFQNVKRFWGVAGILIAPYCKSNAQQWVWEEISKENDGGPFSGLLGTILLLGIIWLLASIFERRKNTKSTSTSNPNIDYNNTIDSIRVGEDADSLLYVDNSFDDPSCVSCEKTKSRSSDVGEVTSSQEIYEKDFRKKCIEIYGDYAENTYGLVLVKEDGEYRQISFPDKRYSILSSFIFQHHKERHTMVCSIGDGDMLKSYIECTQNSGVFPLAKPMDMHGKLEKEYYGERIAMMKAYYWWEGLPTCFEGHSLRDYCLALGWDLCIYIHKYINQPMDVICYRDLKGMVLRNMTKEEYLAYRSKADYSTHNNQGYFDGWGNWIGNTGSEAHAMFKKRQVFTYEQALAEVEQINWSL